ncbi:hypothetical protein [Bythopirellula goksoeyrii]|uniref:Uncharacterized protein n=1 Tax=Bythopirellula goksoeyrii TaxID=1400387 RepID=A0A5B9QGM4_9BACT|nr:hypothetical protein [Bythopirellula goksoeyrii]QEG36732.1 hypothetical protein Pr1d_40680 [Bythopirellula goksoeyrii]
MSLTQSDIDNFHSFASQELPHCDAGQGLEDLVKKWRIQREQIETLNSLHRGIEDAEAGRMRDLNAVDASIREAIGFPARRQ